MRKEKAQNLKEKEKQLSAKFLIRFLMNSHRLSDLREPQDLRSSKNYGSTSKRMDAKILKTDV